MLFWLDFVWSYVFFQEVYFKRDIDKMEYVLQRVIMLYENCLEDMMKFLFGKEKIVFNRYLFKDFLYRRSQLYFRGKNQVFWVEVQGIVFSLIKGER